MMTARPTENSNCYYCYGIYCRPSLHHYLLFLTDLFLLLFFCFQVGFLRLAEMTHIGVV